MSYSPLCSTSAPFGAFRGPGRTTSRSFTMGFFMFRLLVHFFSSGSRRACRTRYTATGV